MNEKILKSHAMCENVVAIAVAIARIKVVTQVFAELRANLCGKMQISTSFQNQFKSLIIEFFITQRIWIISYEKYGLKKEATSNVKIKEVLDKLTIPAGVYMKDDKFTTLQE